MSGRGAPLLPLAVALACGIAASPWLVVAPFALIATGAATGRLRIAALARVGTRAPPSRWSSPASPRSARHAGRIALPADHLVRRALVGTVALEGRLAEEPVRWTPDRTRLLLDVTALHAGPERLNAAGRVQLTVYGELALPLGEDQRVLADARLHRPIGFRNPGGFDYPAHLRREGILLVGHARADRITALTPDAPPWPVAVKRWAVGVITARLPETSAPLLAGLLLGERAALPREIDASFRRAGVYHILAVSGFNVALLAGAVFGVLAMCGIPRRGAAGAAAAALVGFALVVGGQPSVLRATVMGLLLLAALLLDRESQLPNALALAVLALLLWRPGDLWEPGFQLSFAATAGIVYLGPVIAARLAARGAPSWLAAAVAVSLGAQAAVTPLMLAHFNQLSLIGVVANLLVVPLAAVATTLGMLALLVELASSALGALLFHALWPVLIALRAGVAAAAAVPAAMVHLPAPSGATVVAWYGALLLAPGMAASRRVRIVAGVLAVLVATLSIWPWLRPTETMLRVTFLDVGQGDAALIELPEGPRLLVDGGPGGARRFDVGERVLAPFLWNRPLARLDAVALTHWDVDHSGGLAAVLDHFHVDEFWESGRPPGGAPETVAALLAPARPPRAGGRPAPLARPGADHGARSRPRSGADLQRPVAGAAPRLAGRVPAPRGRPGAPRRGAAARARRPGGRARAQGRASRQPLLVHRAVPRAGPAAARGDLGGRAQPVPPSERGGPRPPRRRGRARLSHRSRRRGDPGDRRAHRPRDRVGPRRHRDLGARCRGHPRAGARKHHGPRMTGGRDGRAGSGRRAMSRTRARSERAAAPALRDRDACPGRAPSPPGWS